MKKGGFTLIELLGIIIVLGLISLVAIPLISSILNSSKNDLYNDQVNIIIDSAKKYVLENVTDVTTQINSYVSVDQLQRSGYLESKQIINPKNDEVMNGCVLISYKNNKYKYKYSEEACEELNSVNTPIVEIENNEYNIKVEVNSTINMDNINSKVSARTFGGMGLPVEGPVITKGGKTVSSIDTSILNSKYVLTYSATDTTNNLTGKNKINVLIVDTTRPVISVLASSENQTVTTKVGERYIIPTAAVTDNSLEQIEAVVSGSVNTDVVGSNTITYKALDSSGNEATYILTVVVEN